MCACVCVKSIHYRLEGWDWWGKNSHSINNSTVCRTDQYVHIYKYVGRWSIRTFMYIYKPIEQSAICFLVGDRLVKK